MTQPSPPGTPFPKTAALGLKFPKLVYGETPSNLSTGLGSGNMDTKRRGRVSDNGEDRELNSAERPSLKELSSCFSDTFSNAQGWLLRHHMSSTHSDPFPASTLHCTLPRAPEHYLRSGPAH